MFKDQGLKWSWILVFPRIEMRSRFVRKIFKQKFVTFSSLLPLFSTLHIPKHAEGNTECSPIGTSGENSL